jgi:predicted Zn-ribbon and HTH transcriptional regulator
MNERATEPGDREAPASRRFWLVALAMLPATLGPLGVFLYFSRAGAIPGGGTGTAPGLFQGSSWLFIVAMLGFVLVVPIMYYGAALWAERYQRVRRERSLARATAADGLLCPFCEKRVNLSADASPCCPLAVRSWGEVEYRRYWEMFLTQPAEAQRLLFAASGGVPGAIRLPGFALVLPLLFFSVMPLVSGSPTRVWEAAASAAILLVAAVILTPLMRRGVRVQTAVERCAKCGYQRGNPSDRCPECGHAWMRKFGGTVIRTTQYRPWPIAGAVAVFMIAIGFAMTTRLWLPDLVLSRKPTPSLIAGISAGSDFNEKPLWDEIGRRTLTAAEHAALVDRMVRTLADAQFVGLDAKRILGAARASGALTAEQDAIIREACFRPSISAPSRTRAGATVTLKVAGEAGDAFLAPGDYVFIAAHEAWFADDPERRFVAGERRIEMAMALDTRYGKAPPLAIDIPIDRETMRVGEREVVVRVWLLAGNSLITGRTTWAEDGTPILPTGGRWHEAREVRHRITVEP